MSKSRLAILWIIHKYGPVSVNKIARLIMKQDDFDAKLRDLKNSIKIEFKVGNVFETITNSIIVLADSGLIQVHGESKTDLNFNKLVRLDRNIDFGFSEKAQAILDLLGVDLLELMSRTEDSLFISPLFGTPSHSLEVAQIFVMMPFRDELKSVYSNHITKSAQKLGMTCKRGDDFFSINAIIKDIWIAIYFAELCIADCTGRNANVFYELGIAHTLGRPTILIAQSTQDIPFDIGHIRTIIYENSAHGLLELEERLLKTIQVIFD